MKKRVVNVVLGSILFGSSFLVGFGLQGVVSAHEKSEEVHYEQVQDSVYSENIEEPAQVSANEEQVFVPEIGNVTEEVISEGER